MAAIYTCDGCGQADDHPKLHYGIEQYHHDCIPHRVYRDMTTLGTFIDGVYVESQDQKMHEDTAATVARFVKIVDVCKGGLKGDKLRDRIVKEG